MSQRDGTWRYGNSRSQLLAWHRTLRAERSEAAPVPGFVPAAIVPEPPTAVTPNTGLGCAKSASSCSSSSPTCCGRAGVATSRSAHRKSASFVMRSRRSAASINKRTPPGAGCHLGHLCEAHELFALVELARDPRSTQGAARRCCRHPAAAHGSAALSRSPNRHLAWCASSVSFTSMRRHPTVVAWLFRLWNSCWDGLYRRWSVGTMRRLKTRF